jgi:hypothetical protein
MIRTHHGTHFQLLDCGERNFGNMTESEVGHVHDVGIGHAAILRKSDISDHKNYFEEIQEIILCGIGV